jgi:S-adenosylmethionine:tRNA ribosyltransferase-isomerase
MRTDLFDFHLPESHIALRPVSPRDSARLLVVTPEGRMEHCHVRDLPAWLHQGDVVAVNDSRVIPARLEAIRPPRDALSPAVTVEITLHKREGADRYRAFAQPARRLREGDRLAFGAVLTAEVLSRSGPEVVLAFNRTGSALDDAIAAVGVMPLPPYIARRRPPDARDAADYQTVYGERPGSVAAPTAGLHFTPALLAGLTDIGVDVVRTTLHVGAGTFLPVSAEDTAQHRMHAEHAMLDDASARRLNAAHAQGKRVAAVGTTALRILESAASEDGALHAFDGDTEIFITPGYRFRAVDVLLTNFHLPRSTLFMLVSAFMGLDLMQAVYAEAIARDYRFYSYGDACLLLRPK